MPDNDPPPQPSKYRVVHPHPGQHRELAGKLFEHGVVWTDDADLAKSLTEYGCQVYDGKSERFALGTGTPSEQARIETGRKFAFPAATDQA